MSKISVLCFSSMMMFSVCSYGYENDWDEELFDEVSVNEVAYEDEPTSVSTSSESVKNTTTMHVMQNNNAVFADQPWPDNGNHVSIFGDYFYGNSGVSNLYYAMQGEASSQQLDKRVSHGLGNEWSSGFRIGAGYGFRAQGWDVDLTWFRFHNKATKSISGPGLLFAWSGIANGGCVGSACIDTVLSVHGEWKLEMNQLDLTFGKEFFVSKYYSVRPKAGVRGMWLDEKLKVHHDIELSNTLDCEEKNTIKSWGLKVGLENHFHFGYGLSLDANGEAALLYGNNDNLYKTQASFPTAVGGIIFYGSDFPGESQKDIIPVIDLGLYLRWRDTYAKEKFGLALRAGYEFHALINGFTTRENPYSGGVANLTVTPHNVYIQGLVIGAVLSF